MALKCTSLPALHCQPGFSANLTRNFQATAEKLHISVMLMARGRNGIPLQRSKGGVG